MGTKTLYVLLAATWAALLAGFVVLDTNMDKLIIRQPGTGAAFITDCTLPDGRVTHCVIITSLALHETAVGISTDNLTHGALKINKGNSTGGDDSTAAALSIEFPDETAAQFIFAKAKKGTTGPYIQIVEGDGPTAVRKFLVDDEGRITTPAINPKSFETRNNPFNGAVPRYRDGGFVWE